MNQPNQRVALITGGARGIGLGIARSLAAEGWRVALGGRRPVEEVAEVIEFLCSERNTYTTGSVWSSKGATG